MELSNCGAMMITAASSKYPKSSKKSLGRLKQQGAAMRSKNRVGRAAAAAARRLLA
jgi:hypothetical protein